MTHPDNKNNERSELPRAAGSAKCRHNRTWMISGGYGEWCYECGAYRGLVRVGENASAPRTTWVRPVGKGGENPYEKMREIKSRTTRVSHAAERSQNE